MPDDAVQTIQLRDLLASVAEPDAEILARAYAIAERAHRGQPRRQGTAYIEHLVEVALILRRQLGVTDPAILAAGLLHDAVEDSELTVDDLVDFPDRTRRLVALLTDPSPEMTRAMRSAHYAEIWKDPDATLLKAADRLSNIRDVVAHGDPELTRRYIRKTHRDILGEGMPLAMHPVASPLLRDALAEAARSTHG
ncbi:MAG: HD domain-containing protein [Candidatus Dormibacteria bacterium]|jgi:GTP pyrophosphokinase